MTFRRGGEAENRREPTGREPGAKARLRAAFYLSCVDTLVNVVLRLEPSPLTAMMMAAAIPAAIKPYSMAVAPD